MKVDIIIFSPPHGNRFSDDDQPNRIEIEKRNPGRYRGVKGNIGMLKYGDKAGDLE